MQDTWERLRDAVLVLAGAGPVKQRLTDAYLAHLLTLEPDDLPRDLRATYGSLVAAMQSEPRTGSLDAVAASIRKMSEADAATHAREIVRMFAGLQEPAPQLRVAKVLRAVRDEDELSAFLNRA